MTQGPFDKLLVLDLDETLVHTVRARDAAQVGRAPDFVLERGHATFERPFVREFLQSSLARFRGVGIWTVGRLPYAMEVLPHLCNVDDLAFVWGRERCTLNWDPQKGATYWVKDIRKLRRRGYSRSRILCVDDSPEKFERSYGNYIYLKPWRGDPADEMLLLLDKYLDTLGPLPDVRTVEKRSWWFGDVQNW